MSGSSAVLFSSYLPPVRYFIGILSHEEIRIEQWEHFPKQTYRNRCHIYSANGLLKLSIPIQRGHAEHVKMKDVRISYDYAWQKIHWRSIETAYRCSPFFEYYEDSLAPFYEKQTEFLLDLNQQLLETLLPLLGIKKELRLTDSYTGKYPSEIADYRSSIHPKAIKNNAPEAAYPEYMQVFSSRHGFLPNLSILDLLCNEGPGAPAYLGECINRV